MRLDYSKLEDIRIAKINHRDHPDYVDAFIESATIDGRELTESELDELNEDSSFVHEQVLERLR